MKKLIFNFDGEDYEFTPDSSSLDSEIIDLISKDEKVSKDEAETLFESDEDYYNDIYEEDLLNKYHDNAYEEYKDCKAYQKDPLGYYGVSMSDFI